MLVVGEGGRAIRGPVAANICQVNARRDYLTSYPTSSAAWHSVVQNERAKERKT